MKQQVLTVICLLTVLFAAEAKHNIPATGSDSGLDLLAARQYCMEGTLDDIEGIWSHAEEGFTCLVQSQHNNSYRIIAVQSDDARLTPGMIIGYLFPTPAANIYDMYLYTSFKNDAPSAAKECVATLSSDGEGISLAFKKYKFTPNPIALLPWMWRLMRINVENPLDKMPRGLTKVAPSYDKDGSSKRHPRYL